MAKLNTADKFAKYISLFYNPLKNSNINEFPKDKSELVNLFCMFIANLNSNFTLMELIYRKDLNIISARLLYLGLYEDTIEINIGIDLNTSGNEQAACSFKHLNKLVPSNQTMFAFSNLCEITTSFEDAFTSYINFCETFPIYRMEKNKEE